MATSTAMTIPRLFLDQVHRDGDQAALHYKQDGAWITQTWQQVADRVGQTVGVLQHLGVMPGDRVVQLSENRSQWLITDLAIQLCGAIHVPIHTPLTGPQVAYQVLDSGAQLVLVSNKEQAQKLVAGSAELPQQLQVVSYDPCPQDVVGTEILLLQQLVEAIPGSPAERVVPSVQPDSLATILYTSGTTGDPKGVMLTQENLVSNAAGTLEAFGQETGDVRLGFLPLSHIFARTCDLYTWLFGGTELALAESPDTVLADCAEIQPMLLNAVPYFYDKLYRSLQEQGLVETPGILRKLLGGRIRSCSSGGAALPNNLFDFFLSQEVPLYQGYGLTEASPVITVSSTQQVKRGSVGKPLQDVEVQLADDGEIMTRGPHVMAGYYENLAATQEVVQDGWLYTGDLGSIDEEGFLFITGRKKEIIVTLGGKNIAPVLLESLLMEDPLIEQVMVIGSERKFLVALVYPGLSALSRELDEATINLLDRPGLFTDARVLRLFEERIADRLADLSPYEQIGQFTLIDRPFSQEFNELTPKLSLRRSEIEENFSRQIETMYQATRGQ
ncbi:MAG: AMP-dependent synthetase/ligase [Pirellulaceae bacterium]